MIAKVTQRTDRPGISGDSVGRRSCEQGSCKCLRTQQRYHRSMKDVVKLEHYYFPWELETAVRDFVNYYNHRRYHESLDNCTPADVYYGRQH